MTRPSSNKVLTADSPQAARLKDTAYAMAQDQGLAALSARSLSRETGMSPSAINYYYGNRDLLISEISAFAIETSQHWRGRRASLQETQAPEWADFDHVFTGLLQDRLSQSRMVLALLQELEHETAGGEKPAIRAALAQEMATEADFWRDLAISYGESVDAAEIWVSLALGLTGLMLSEGDAARRSPWLSAPATRLRQRLRHRPVDLIALGGPDAARLAAAAPESETTEAILGAALDVIAEKGPERLTQREVATRAGVSLAAITYFFRTKSDLISAAFSELCRQHCLTLPDGMTDAPHKSAAQMLAFRDAASLSGMKAMDALLRAAVRMPELTGTAQLIRQTRGVASIVLLRRLGLAVDHLDAYLWASMLAGRYRLIRFMPQEDQSTAIAGMTELTLKLVFDGAL
ncbi:TetR/AcrR family transcriptional regulator [Sphingobium sp. EM0848]|uniref:TetR/AcrR family transcriptional regulator n=1 Tax=Sphingobium sp. EM0848 TaxID=2743473 RepID=UPI00159C34F6|nr:TetR/AcrR family transcriptional regulator [Sphingobium sp. EM0848]